MYQKILLSILVVVGLNVWAQVNLPPPLLLEKDKMFSGNPLATYRSMLDREKEYLASPVSRIYIEQKAMMEELMGVPYAGTKAMELFKTPWNESDTIPPGYVPVPALEVIIKRAAATNTVVWGEEHHLPQTRNMYSDLLRELWKLGYKYLAAEAFSETIMNEGPWISYQAGLYTRDPIYAYAIHEAIKMGYKLIPYETSERGPDNEPGFRDRKQAEQIKEKIFDTDKNAKVLILAGRGHASEKPAQDGWMPMAAVLKKITGSDPLTLFAPTMVEKSTLEEEHPSYRQANRNNRLTQNSIFINPDNDSLYGSSFDAYVFFPRVELKNGRPDWIFKVQGRKSVKVPKKYWKGKGLRLIQAFSLGQDTSAIPVDQFLVTAEKQVFLALPAGEYYIRCIDPGGNIIGSFQKEMDREN